MGWGIGRIAGAISTGGLSEVAGVGKNIDNAQDSLLGKVASKSQDASSGSSNNYKEGIAEGAKSAESLYGMGDKEISSGVQDVFRMRREAVGGEGPQADYLRQQRNNQIRMARAAGASPEEIAQINRSAASDVGNAQYNQYQRDLGNYQNIVGNILSGTQSTKMGYGALAAGNQYIAPPTTGGGGILGSGTGTVICTELHRQGYMSDSIYRKDQLFGYRMATYHPEVYWGYRIMARPVVKLMKKSKLFTKLISYPALAWAEDMAGHKNYVGRFISVFGTIICKHVGEYHGKDRNKKKEAAC